MRGYALRAWHRRHLLHSLTAATTTIVPGAETIDCHLRRRRYNRGVREGLGMQVDACLVRVLSSVRGGLTPTQHMPTASH
jgi:hypothetical protein